MLTEQSTLRALDFTPPCFPQAYAEQTLHRPEHRLDAFLELHIEQGPVLEEQNTTIGMVTAIAAPAMIRVEFSGAGGHGGGMPMRAR